MTAVGAGAAMVWPGSGGVAIAAGADLVVGAATTEYDADPLGIEQARPRLSWVLVSEEPDQVQTAYQVLVATREEWLTEDRADVWNSGRVESAQSLNVSVDGAELTTGTRYHWVVRVWDGRGRPSPWSPVAWWEMGYTTEADWGRSRWIGSPPGRVESEGVVLSWEFDHDGDTDGWEPLNDLAPLEVLDGELIGQVQGPDPYLHSPRLALNAATDRLVRVRLRASGGSGITVYFITDRSPGWSDTTSVSLPVQADGELHEYLIDMADKNAGWQGTVLQLRIDLDGAGAGSTLALDQVRVERGSTEHLVTGGPLLRTDFVVAKEVVRARLRVCGLGYHVVSIDGERVGDSVLDPGFTVYDQTALYVTHDVTDALRTRGAHALGVALGRGFYGLPAEDTLYWGGAPWLDDPRLRLALELEYRDGTRDTIVSDESWQVAGGPTTRDSVYLGETYDARLEQPGWDLPGFAADGWYPATEVTAPTAVLRPQLMEPIRVVDTLTAVDVATPKPGTFVFTFPVVTAGWARLRVSGAAGTEVVLRFGETLREDGTVNNDGDPGLTNGPIQTDRYLLRGDGVETWEPSFTYHGFQYVQVDGYPGTPTVDDVHARVVHTDVRSTGRFSSSNELLNTIHDITRRAMLNNLHSVMTDSPIFEKRAWLGDVIVLVPTTIDNFAMQPFYRSWLTSITDNQGPDGAGVELSPNPGPAGYADPVWAGALVEIPWQLYQEYGDVDVLAETYAATSAYVDYLTARSDGLIQDGFYGDWVSPATSGTFPWPPEGPRLTATAYFHRCATLLASIAAVLGNDDDEARFTTLADQIARAFTDRFLDRAAGVYRTDTDVGYRQTSNVVPLRFGLVPDELVDTVVDNLLADIRERGNHLDTGHVGTNALLPALTEAGHVDTAFAIATQRTYPSWGYWIEQGATTTWEAWETTTRSRSHAFLGSVDDWFFRYLAGVRPAAPGYEQIAVKPYVPRGLDSAEASIETVRGTVSSAWQVRGRDLLSLEVEIPAGATAEVSVPTAPGGSVRVLPRDGAELLRTEDGYTVFGVGSGRREFVSRVSGRRS